MQARLSEHSYKNIQQLMIEIFKYLKGMSPPIMNEIFRLRNIPYTIRNPRDLDCRLPKTMYCGLETSTQRTTIMATTTCENEEK